MIVSMHERTAIPGSADFSAQKGMAESNNGLMKSQLNVPESNVFPMIGRCCFLIATGILFFIFFLAAGAFAKETITAGDPRIAKTGRYYLTPSGNMEIGASGVSLYVRFAGSGLTVEIADEQLNGNGYNYLSVIIDGVWKRRLKTDKSNAVYTIAENLAPGLHSVILCKDTEGQNGIITVSNLTADLFLDYGPLPNRTIEIIGNSISAGMGIAGHEIPCNSAQWFDQHHAWNSYGLITARNLNATWNLVAVSGIGITRNWNTPGPVMPAIYYTRFLKLDTYQLPWDKNEPPPDVVLIELGTNDFSDGDGTMPREKLDSSQFVNSYRSFIYKIRKQYSESKIILLSSPVLSGEKKDQMNRWLPEIIRSGEFKNVFHFLFASTYTNGCDGHPDLKDHQQMAGELTAEIKKITGW